MVAGMMQREIGHGSYPVLVFQRRSQLMQVTQIVIVHADEEVEIIKITFPYTACPVVQPVTACERRAAHPAVGEITDVSAIESGRVTLDPAGKPTRGYDAFGYPLRSRASANVAQADEKQSYRSVALTGMPNRRPYRIR